jgi:rfaE bifunctional protein nucleotidyltransferase chain/domain/rfaE bifunctional protein kinase chain/domain
MTGTLVVIGDALLDRDVNGRVERLCPDAPVPVLDETTRAERPGGAGLAAALAARDGRAVTLVTALADDAAGALLRELLERDGVDVVDLGLEGTTPEKIRLRSGASALLRLDRGERGAVGEATATARAAIGWAGAVLVSDYGRGVAAEPGLRAALCERAAAGLPIVWDPHPRGAVPVARVALATPNLREARQFAGEGVNDEAASPLADAAALADALRRRWDARAVCVTRGAHGAVLDDGGPAPLAIPADPVAGGDPCGAGDRFAATAAGRLADGAPPLVAVEAATNAATAFVAAGGAAAFPPPSATSRRLPREPTAAPEQVGHTRRSAGDLRPRETAAPPDPLAPLGDAGARDPFALAEAIRARGGTVVATGGCFDLLHAGHVRMLEAARALGDGLVVCLNSDASVQRLKGPDRPLVAARERATVLAALACVDAVAVFDEDTPTALLELLRPDLWVKGGDYAGETLPEAEALASWGGRVVLVPHHAGHSTTRLIEEAAHRAAS